LLGLRQPIQAVIVMALVQSGVCVAVDAGDAAGGVVAVMADVRQLGVGVEAPVYADGAAGEVVAAFGRLVVTPVPTVDLAVRFVADPGEQRLAVEVNGLDAVA